MAGERGTQAAGAGSGAEVMKCMGMLREAGRYIKSEAVHVAGSGGKLVAGTGNGRGAVAAAGMVDSAETVITRLMLQRSRRGKLVGLCLSSIASSASLDHLRILITLVNICSAHQAVIRRAHTQLAHGLHLVQGCQRNIYCGTCSMVNIQHLHLQQYVQQDDGQLPHQSIHTIISCSHATIEGRLDNTSAHPLVSCGRVLSSCTCSPA